jgi:hypothetical protein
LRIFCRILQSERRGKHGREREREQESFSQRNRFPAENNGRLKGSAPMDQRMDDSVGGMEGSLDKDLSSLPSAIGKPERERERDCGGPKHLGSQRVSFVGSDRGQDSQMRGQS